MQQRRSFQAGPAPSRFGTPRGRRAAAATAALVLLLSSCGGSRPSTLGLTGGGLAPCPSSPNCVSSAEPGSDHAVAPLVLAVEPSQGWASAREAVAQLPRTRVVVDTGSYLHAECSSALFGFIDDLELHLPEGGDAIAVRSSSRLGYSDMGVNRRRVEELRAVLQERGICRSDAP